MTKKRDGILIVGWSQAPTMLGKSSADCWALAMTCKHQIETSEDYIKEGCELCEKEELCELHAYRQQLANEGFIEEVIDYEVAPILLSRMQSKVFHIAKINMDNGDATTLCRIHKNLQTDEYTRDFSPTKECKVCNKRERKTTMGMETHEEIKSVALIAVEFDDYSKLVDVFIDNVKEANRLLKKHKHEERLKYLPTHNAIEIEGEDGREHLTYAPNTIAERAFEST